MPGRQLDKYGQLSTDFDCGYCLVMAFNNDQFFLDSLLITDVRVTANIDEIVRQAFAC